MEHDEVSSPQSLSVGVTESNIEKAKDIANKIMRILYFMNLEGGFYL
jgi:hypothetical protein